MSGVRQVSRERNVIDAPFYVPPPEESFINTVTDLSSSITIISQDL